MPIKFLANKNTIISGPTGSGKTQFVLDVIRQKLIHPFPKNIYYMYKVEQVEMFILGSHHRQVSLFFITQGLFHNCDQFRLMSNNAHYYVIFNNKRNASQINHLARQVFIGKEQQRIINAYKRAGSKEYGFIVLSFAPEIPDELTVVTDFWEICPSVYL